MDPAKRERYIAEISTVTNNKSVTDKRTDQPIPATLMNQGTPSIGKPWWGLAEANTLGGPLVLAHGPIKTIYRLRYLALVEPTSEHPVSTFKNVTCNDICFLFLDNNRADDTQQNPLPCPEVGKVATGFFREPCMEGEEGVVKPFMIGVGKVVYIQKDFEVCIVKKE
ncbi:hypothetical protein BJY01DRAFT_244892 [Aspergillus pseudoustus]|uniref:Uncharacterized protein n=1 Tax=Aspergillus pseudoustus TaxID=1810923 RepID=A0ABR4KGZ5_9EURO